MKYFITVLCLIVSNMVLMGQTEPTDKDGNGYINISTIDELRWVSENPSSWGKNFELDNNIDASETKDWNNGKGFAPIEEFTGDFNGDNFVISNLNINDTNRHFTGLFGRLELGSHVENLTLKDCRIIGSGYTGGIAGYSFARLINCSVIGDIRGGNNVGGIIGINFDLTLKCRFEGNVIGYNYVGGISSMNYDSLRECSSRGSVRGNGFVGGLVGYNQERTETYRNIIECYSRSSVSGRYNIGGLVGLNDGIVNECYSTGKVTGEDNAGGLIGGYGKEFVFDSFWDIETSRLNNSSGGVGKNTNEMKREDLYSNLKWDFDDTWQLLAHQNGGYPFFKWEPITSVKSYNPELGFSIYPNPASDYIIFKINNNQIIESIELQNITGKTVLEINDVSFNGQINISNLSKGTYLVYVYTSIGSSKTMFIKE